MHRLTSLLVVATFLTGCAAKRPPLDTASPGVGRTELEWLPSPERVRPADVSPAALPPEGAPKTLSQALPAYPDQAVDDGVACDAELLYHIETDGSATLVRLTWTVPSPTAHVDAFESAIHDAVSTWEFAPGFQLMRKTDADGKLSYEKRLIPRARRAAVRFRVEDGKGVVE